MSSSNKMKFFIRLLFGKYSANDYIRLGRYISGGYGQIRQEKV
mgnify:CR=1 FL=1